MHVFSLSQNDALRALADEKAHTIRLMLEQERRHAEGLRQALASSPALAASPSARQAELCAAERRMATLQEQLDRIRSSKVC